MTAGLEVHIVQHRCQGFQEVMEGGVLPLLLTTVGTVLPHPWTMAAKSFAERTALVLRRSRWRIGSVAYGSTSGEWHRRTRPAVTASPITR